MNIMTFKKLTFCILCFANAANLATDEDFNNENSSDSKVEENINKNSWNTKKWGSIYILSTMYSIPNMGYEKSFLYNGIENEFIRYLNILFSWAVEYKYMFNKNIGINVRLNLNNIDAQEYRFAFEPSIEWVYGRKGKKIFSGSFSPLNLRMRKDYTEFKFDLVWSFILLKYECSRNFYLNFGHIKNKWSLTDDLFSDILQPFLLNIISIELGFNIVGKHDLRLSKKNISVKL